MSIYGNPLILGKSLSETDAVLEVTVPAGSAVTAEKNGIVLLPTVWSYVVDDRFDCDVFIIPASLFDIDTAWTVTADKSPYSKDGTIIIDSANKYELEIYYITPRAYQPVEYIRSSGSQYIKTGISQTSSSWGFEIDFNPGNSFGTSGYGTIFGKRTSANSQEYHLTTYNDGTTGGVLRIGNKNYSAYMTRNTRQQCSLHSLTYTRPTGATTAITSTSITAREVYLFGLNQNGSVIQEGTVSLYSMKLFNGSDELVADYIPCKRVFDSVAGLWDRVGEKFLRNSGSGSFSTGENTGYS